jgi:hypothetical protein
MIDIKEEVKEKLKKFRITEEYSDLCFFRKITEIEAVDEEAAQELYEEGEEDYLVIMDEMFDQNNDSRWREITDIEEVIE